VEREDLVDAAVAGPADAGDEATVVVGISQRFVAPDLPPELVERAAPHDRLGDGCGGGQLVDAFDLPQALARVAQTTETKLNRVVPRRHGGLIGHLSVLPRR
jgi:hypothetical protein